MQKSLHQAKFKNDVEKMQQNSIKTWTCALENYRYSATRSKGESNHRRFWKPYLTAFGLGLNISNAANKGRYANQRRVFVTCFFKRTQEIFFTNFRFWKWCRRRWTLRRYRLVKIRVLRRHFWSLLRFRRHLLPIFSPVKDKEVRTLQKETTAKNN